MQNDPEKLNGNYNEYRGLNAPPNKPAKAIDVYSDNLDAATWQDVVYQGMNLVNTKVKQIFGHDTSLTNNQLTFPKVIITQSFPQNPQVGGYFSAANNEIVLVADKIPPFQKNRTIVFIHEYLHYLSHNGKDEFERINNETPVSNGNNIGFSRNYGLDIRAGRVGQITYDYFLSFNEAVTEQLAIDILPGADEVYQDYRDLLDQVISDAVSRKLGTTNSKGAFVRWGKEQVQNYIYSCYFRGDHAGFTTMLKTIYAKYNISEQQFGLMTHKDDLPSVIERKIITNNPSGPPPAPMQIEVFVQNRLNNKTSEDYRSDVEDPDPYNGGSGGHKFGIEYDNFVAENNIKPYSSLNVDGTIYKLDNLQYVIYEGHEATRRLQIVREELDSLIANGVSVNDINVRIDKLLFEIYRMSMLTHGFKDFYIYKHLLLEQK